MEKGLKKGLTLLLTLLLLASAGQLNLFTAQAFAVRKTAPSAGDSHYYSKANPFYSGGYQNECTWYVWGRAYEALGHKPNLSNAAAHQWYRYNTGQKACPYGEKPKVGSIMVTTKDSEHGHVAFVEELYSDGTMLISEYNYNVRGGFSTQVIKQLPAGAKRGRAHKVLGYIYVTDSKPVKEADRTGKDEKKNTTADEQPKKASGKGGAFTKLRNRTEEPIWQNLNWFDTANRSNNKNDDQKSRDSDTAGSRSDAAAGNRSTVKKRVGAADSKMTDESAAKSTATGSRKKALAANSSFNLVLNAAKVTRG